MKFDNDVFEYLEGRKFTNSLKVKFSPHKFLVQTRLKKIEEIVSGKSVIHLGCADHLELIEDKIEKGKWLHGNLIDKTTRCIGIDINREAIDFLTEKLQIPNVYCFDIEKDERVDSILGDEKWDYLLLGEIIEHVNNPVAFLENIQKRFAGKVKNIILTAPNVLNIFVAKWARKNTEHINSDHRYWFSPFTLTKIMLESSFSNCNLEFVEHVPLPFFKEANKHIHRLLKIPYYLHAAYFSTILLVADFKS